MCPFMGQECTLQMTNGGGGASVVVSGSSVVPIQTW